MVRAVMIAAVSAMVSEVVSAAVSAMVSDGCPWVS